MDMNGRNMSFETGNLIFGAYRLFNTLILWEIDRNIGD